MKLSDMSQQFYAYLMTQGLRDLLAAMLLGFIGYRLARVLPRLLAACRRENAMAHYKALRLVRRRPFAQKNHRGVSENVLGREVFLPVWSLSTRAYALPHPA